MPRNIKLTLEYDGTDFAGFQFQPGRPTIQQVLEEALSKFFDKPMKIKSASGRTDAGVHAKYQVVNFRTDSKADLWQIQKGLNAHLPDSIAVRKAEEVPAGFHARFQAKGKTYEYTIWNDRVRSPFQLRYAHQVASPLNVSAMRRAAKILVGKHDFRSFCATEKPGQPKKETTRTIQKFVISKKGALICLRITANGFLHHMVRNIAGTLMEVGRGKLKADEVEKILKSKDRKRAGMTAPAKALCLVDVTY